MRHLLLAAAVLLFTTTANAQLANGSFENWHNDSAYLSLPIGGLKDTSFFVDPDNWTSSNALTAGKTLGFRSLCTQNTTEHFDGSSSIKIETDSFSFTVSGFPINIIVPGFVVNGDFKIDLAAFTSFNLTNIPGAGVPINKRMGKIKGQLKYQPVGNDSCAVIGILKKGSTLVAMAQYFHKGTDAGFIPFEVPFQYQSCEIPDTAMIIVSSGNPLLFTNILTQSTSGLHRGTVLFADSINMVDTASAAMIPPFAHDDNGVQVTANVPTVINVTANDEDCFGRSLTVTGTTPAMNGSVTVSSGLPSYFPNNNFTGADSFSYTITNGSLTSTARVRLSVAFGVGINNLEDTRFSISPNPANAAILVQNRAGFPVIIEVSDVLGRKVYASEITSLNQYVPTSSWENGIYQVQLFSGTGQLLKAEKVVIAH
ncbi:MAG: Ig-like domain-containing protein [Chitinophagales bacterium]